MPSQPPPSNIRAIEPADLAMRFDWYADPVFAVQIVHEVYGGSLAMIADDPRLDRVGRWQTAQPAPDRCGETALRVWRGEAVPATFPEDGRELYRYGFATAVAPRALQALCCLCAARRARYREPAGISLGRGRPRPLLLEWQAGARLASSYADGAWRDAPAPIDDLDRALHEVAVEHAIGTAAELLPRSQLRALSGVQPDAARAALATNRSRTAASLARRVGKRGKVP